MNYYKLTKNIKHIKNKSKYSQKDIKLNNHSNLKQVNFLCISKILSKSFI